MNIDCDTLIKNLSGGKRASVNNEQTISRLNVLTTESLWQILRDSNIVKAKSRLSQSQTKSSDGWGRLLRRAFQNFAL